MALQKQPIDISFAQGVDTKTDPKRVSPGRFLELTNSIFTKQGLLQKRNGFEELAPLPTTDYTSLATLADGLVAFGKNIAAYADGANKWIVKGKMTAVNVSSAPLIRSNTNQSQADAAVASNGLVCVAYTDDQPGGSVYKYAISDAASGHNIVSPTVISPPGGIVSQSPAVYVFGNFFMILFTSTIGGNPILQYIAIPTNNPAVPSAVADISTTYTPAASQDFDAAVIGNQFFVAWNGNDVGGSVYLTSFLSTLQRQGTVSFAGHAATVMAINADITSSPARVFLAFYDSVTRNGYVLATDTQLVTQIAPTAIITGEVVTNISLAVSGHNATVLYEAIASGTHLVKTLLVSDTGSIGSTSIIKRGVGLASSAFVVDGTVYNLLTYSSPLQPTYFLSDAAGNIVGKLAYSNGGGYVTTGTPAVTVEGKSAYVVYLKKDLIQAVSKANNTTGTSVYSQTGVFLARFDINANPMQSVETASDLHVSGGFLWMYDGLSPVEHGFFLWPEGLTSTTSGTGVMTRQDYYYAAVYEWSDAAGNIHQSAPSVPLLVPSSSFSGSTGSVTVTIPTLRLTYKTANPVKIVLYRWSTAQQVYYQVTSTTAPLLNSTTVDTVSFVDNQADSSILGARILYTTGGVLENIAAPATNILTLFQSRLFLVDAENPNLIWFSKQVIDATPVETSDLLTVYLPSSVAAQGNTGPITALSSMDDKLIIFKKNAVYYMTGVGPDNTGANNQFSEPTFITATVGCVSPESIVFMPNGLMFQSDKGIWLLGRDLSTNYIGAPVEDFNSMSVRSSVAVPATNQVRFNLTDGTVLMYDYFFNQWGTFTNVPAVASKIHTSLHTFVNSLGRVYREKPGSYLDGGTPVLMSFQTGWMNLAGLQGYERFYFMNLLGEYMSPFKLNVEIAYDFAPVASQSIIVTPDNYNKVWGGDPLWGDSAVWGGPLTTFEARVFPVKQKCESFQISIQEIFDPAFPSNTGAGLTLSGLNLIVGLKKVYRTNAA